MTAAALNSSPNSVEVAQIIDHTLLKPEATPADVAAFIEQGLALGVGAICLSPSMLPVDSRGMKVVAVCGFPFGTHHAEIKAAEAARAIADGADEIDMVIDLGLAKAGNWEALRNEIRTVRKAVPAPKLLKVIIESAALTDTEIVECCRASEAAGADFVKTSTGYHAAGGASVHAVKLMAATVGGRLAVKASGGIHTGGEALALIAAGATRLGVSGTKAVVAGVKLVQSGGSEAPSSNGGSGY